MSSEQTFWDFVSGTYPLTNFSANAIVAESDPLPAGMIGQMIDSSIIFTTSGGTVALQIKRSSGGVIRFTDTFTSTATGLQGFSMSAGDKLQLILTATGSGVIDLNLHGEIKQNTNVQLLKQAQQAENIQFITDGL